MLAPIAENAPIDTRNHILDVAERLFAAGGISGTSLRQLTAEAGVNVAAVHYHFGSRNGLIDALFARRLGPMNRERIDNLRARLAGDDQPDLDRILEVFLRPAFRLCRDESGVHFVRLLGSCHTDPEPEIALIIDRQFEEAKRHFLPALQTALPHLSTPELFWRMQFVLGAMARSLTGGRGLELIAETFGSELDWDSVQAQLLQFACAGLRAPATPVASIATGEDTDAGGPP